MKKLFAKTLRKKSTDVESIIWFQLRNRRFYNYKFRWQEPIGNFIVDFVCLEKMLVVELDGGQHGETVNYDNQRTKFLNNLGYRVIRFWNNEVITNLTGVMDYIEQCLSD